MARRPQTLAEKRKADAERQQRRRDRLRIMAELGLPNGRAAAPKATPNDVATTIRDRILAAVEGMSDEDLLSGDYAKAIGLGLKAESQKDKRVQKTRPSNIVALAVLHIIDPERYPRPLLDDGKTIEGEAVEL